MFGSTGSMGRDVSECGAPLFVTVIGAGQVWRRVSNYTPAITSEVLYVDAGFHIADMVFH